MTDSYLRLFEIFMNCEELGIALGIDGGKLVGSPAELIPPDLATRIKANKDAIKLALARSSNLPSCRLCAGLTVGIPTFDGYVNAECPRCGECSGCRRGTA